MTGRIPFGLITLLAVAACLPLKAQDSGFLPASNAQTQATQAGTPSPGYYFGIPLDYGYQGGADCEPGQVSQTLYRELPEDSGLRQEETPLGRALLQKVRQIWFRPEYLNWNINGPGNQLLGEQTASGVRQTYFGFSSPPPSFLNQPNVPIKPGMDFITPTVFSVNNVIGTTRTPDLSDVSISNLNGFRGTFGIPTKTGQLELSSFVLGARSVFSPQASIFVPGSLIQGQIGNTDPFWTTGNPQTDPVLFAGVYRLPDGSFPTANGLPPENPHISTFFTQVALVNGQHSDAAEAFINYDISYQSRLTTSVWGSEGNFVFDSTDPNSPLQIRPTLGFRYLNFRDRLDQNGFYYSDSTRTVAVERDINSAANNNFYGPQVGLRAEASFWNFLVGFEPKVMLGLNTWQSNLDTVHVFGAVDPLQSFQQRSTTFAPVVDLKGYGNFAINNNLSAYFSYNFMYATNVIHSYNNFTYNNPSFFMNKNYGTAMIQGFSFGFDLRF